MPSRRRSFACWGSDDRAQCGRAAKGSAGPLGSTTIGRPNAGAKRFPGFTLCVDRRAGIAVGNRYATFKNLLYQAVVRRRFLTMARKVVLRTLGGSGRQLDHARWAESNATDMDQVMNDLDSALWQESQSVSTSIQAEAERVLSQYPVRLGGAGCYPLIYFVTRMLKPNVAVETGVAAGFSSYATLLAMEANERGILHSSDLPYFRLPNPEQYVGVLVPEGLRARWQLSIEGDRRNIPKILNELTCIDFIHYDSDKSYRERKWTMQHLMPLTNEGRVVIMDDIQDDSYFAELVSGTSDWHVFRFGGKYLGVIGLDGLAASAGTQKETERCPPPQG